jgi:hypothetical protein
MIRGPKSLLKNGADSRVVASAAALSPVAISVEERLLGRPISWRWRFAAAS